MIIDPPQMSEVRSPEEAGNFVPAASSLDVNESGSDVAHGVGVQLGIVGSSFSSVSIHQR